MKIYTKTGDNGQTSLIGGRRVSKTHSRIRIYGQIDELNSYMGILIALAKDDRISAFLTNIQQTLFNMGAEFAAENLQNIPKVTAQDVERIETEIDALTLELQPQKTFILPQGNLLIAHIHVARTITRRVERDMYLLDEVESEHGEALKWINRLSDYLFVLARYIHKIEAVPEIAWKGL